MLKFGLAIDKGIKRQERPNQDAISVLAPRKGLFGKKRPPLFIVADGMGGYQGGEVASDIVIQSTDKYYKQHWRRKNVQKVLSKAIKKAHVQIRKFAKRNPDLANMGSTIAAVVIDEKKNMAYLANVGDSRIYLLDGTSIQLVSYDHSVVGEQVRAGVITREEADIHPKKNVLSMSLSAQRPKDQVTPFTTEIAFDFDDILLLCSDGLWGPIQESIIHAVVLELSPQNAAQKLVNLANAHGGPDNISAIIIKRIDPDKKADNQSSLEDTNPGLG